MYLPVGKKGTLASEVLQIASLLIYQETERVKHNTPTQYTMRSASER